MKTVFTPALASAASLLFVGLSASAAASGPDFPLPVFPDVNSFQHESMEKTILDRRVLADMEPGQEDLRLNVTRVLSGDGELSRERAKFGEQSYKITAELKPGPHDRLMGAALLGFRPRGREDWSDYNRLSVWVYPNVEYKGVEREQVNFKFLLGKEHSREIDEIPSHVVTVPNKEWTEIIWEIEHIDRSAVSGATVAYDMLGFEDTEDGKQIEIFIDQMELQKVDAFYTEGWEVAPGEVSYSHTGYRPEAPKQAFTSDLSEPDFEIVDARTQQPVFKGRATEKTTPIGTFQILDFSELTEPGLYEIHGADRQTQPFAIAEHVWDRTILKAINFFYSQRCGVHLEGIHPVCHLDWIARHGEEEILVNGGWHDAGDLTQVIERTGRSLYGMLLLADTVQQQERNAPFLPHLVDEIRWGLDWVLKTSFHDGHRGHGGKMGAYTDNIVGTPDDALAVEPTVYDKPEWFYRCVMIEALAAKVFKESDPELAERALQMAIEDWEFAEQKMGKKPLLNHQMPHLGIAAHASADLYAVTGEERFKERAVAYADALARCQEKSFLPGAETPITGYLTKSPRSNVFDYYSHESFADAGVNGMARVAEVLPEHETWMEWYAFLTLYSEYFAKPTSAYFEPYGVIPAGIYREDQDPTEIAFWLSDPRWKPYLEGQLGSGIKLGGGHILRFFPIQVGPMFRGHTNGRLSYANAVAAAGVVRGSNDAVALGENQLQWTVGRNPFNQSLMYGEGYRYSFQYSAKSGNIVGALPVGVKWKDNSDTPYWPSSTYAATKECWVSPTGRWFWVVDSVYRQSAAESAAELRRVTRDGKIHLQASEGFDGEVELKTWNLRLEDADPQPASQSKKPTWSGTIIDPNKPWIAVARSVEDPAVRAEATGHAGESGAH